MFGLWESSSNAILDLDGKVAVVTGGNAGIGSAIVEMLAVNGAKVYMGARSEKRAAAAIQKIQSAHPEIETKGLVEWLPLDLTIPADVVKSANEFKSKEDRLDLLINNAARLASDFKLSDEGVELSVAINHVGHFVLVENLMPVLRATAARPDSDARIFTMSSSAHYLCPKISKLRSVGDLNRPWPGFEISNSFWAQVKRYTFTKVLNQLFTIELQRRLDEERADVMALSADPGFVATEGSIVTWPWLLQPFARIFAASEASGAKSALFATTSADVKKDAAKYKAAYLDAWGWIGRPSAQAKDAQLAGDLWKLTRDIVDHSLAGSKMG